jgi:copper homeostasis protein CutC
MAFDETPNVIESLNILIKTGKFKRILTKGGKFLSALGIKLIKNS